MTEQAYIQKLRSVPKQKFLFGPSPVQFLPRLSNELSPSGDVKIYAKREDVNSGLAYGGNKVRKLEYHVADAIAKGCDTLVSVGGVQSNHTRAVTAVATAAGLKAVTVQEKWVPIDPPLYDKTGNILLSRLMGGDVRLNQEGFHIGHKSATQEAVKDVKDGERSLTTVTGSSHAGLIVGAVAESKGRRVIGIDASGKPEETKKQVARIARNTAKLLDDNLEIPDDAIVLDNRFHEGIYGIPGPSTIEAMKLAARTDAMITDPVYEGKSMARLIQLVKEGAVGAGSNVLYVHLGGQPALNAYSSYFDEEVLK